MNYDRRSAEIYRRDNKTVDNTIIIKLMIIWFIIFVFYAMIRSDFGFGV